jgi:hypothetical protein
MEWVDPSPPHPSQAYIISISIIDDGVVPRKFMGVKIEPSSKLLICPRYL